MYLHESGINNTSTVLFLHGAGGGGWMWQQQMDALDEYHCLAPDLPEHGQSVSEFPFEMNDVVRDIANLIRTKSYEGSADVIGLSLGGQITIELMNQYPDTIKHAIISGALARPINFVRMLSPLMRIILRCYEPVKSSDFSIKANMKAHTIPAIYERNFREDIRLLKSDSFARLLTNVMTYKLPSGLERVTSPTLVIAGEKEYTITRQSVKDLVAAIPGAQGRIARRMKHNWNMQDSRLFTCMVRSWIQHKPLPQELVPFS
ncbi:alpha/beta fold hydrolase [Chloroflexota bacterium]